MDLAKEADIDQSTIEGKMLAALVNNGLFPEQAREVLAAYKATDSGRAMENRWNESADAYPAVVVNTVWMGLKHQAVEWIEENSPLHWAKPMFTGKMPDVPSSDPA